MLSAFFWMQYEREYLDGTGVGSGAGRLGPMFMPRLWRRVILSMTQLPDRLLHRFGGGLVVAGMVIYCMLRLHGEL